MGEKDKLKENGVERNNDEFTKSEQTIKDALASITLANTEEKAQVIVRSLFTMAAQIIRLKRGMATEEECIGIALAETFPKDSSISKIALTAMSEHGTPEIIQHIREKV